MKDRSLTAGCILFFVLASICGTAIRLGADGLALVRWVDDGDTIVLADGTRVRYGGINAPEVAHEDKPAERFGPEAGDFNRRLVYKKRVRLEHDEEKFDQYGRVLAYVFLEDGTFVNAELVKTGHAHVVFRRPNTRYDAMLLAVQQEAMAKRKGMWKRLSDQGGPFLGNRYSRRFHRLTCPFGKAMKPDRRMIFQTKYDAFWAGFSPCKKCLDGGASE